MNKINGIQGEEQEFFSKPNIIADTDSRHTYIKDQPEYTAAEVEKEQANDFTETKIKQRDIRSPYKTDDLTKHKTFETTQALPQSSKVIDSGENIFEQLIDDLKKLPEESQAAEETINLLKEFVTLRENLFTPDANFSTFFEKYKFTQQKALSDNGTKLGLFNLSQNTSATPDQLEGDQATRHTSQSLGNSLGTKITCFASGVTLFLEPFTTTELSTLCLLLSISDSTIGRSTGGAAYSGDDVYLHSIIVDTLLEKVSGTNVEEINTRLFDKNRLKSLLLVTDIQQLMAGGLVTIYPRGYPIWHPCINPTCDYNVVAARNERGEYSPDSLLIFSELTHNRTELLNSEDYAYWSKPTVKEAEVLQYQKRREDIFNTEFNSKQRFFVREEGNVSNEHWLQLKIPNLLDYFTEAQKWCISIESYIARVVDQNRPGSMSEKAYNEFRKLRTHKYAMDVALGKYTPFVSYIEIIDKLKPAGNKVISKREAVFTQLTEVYSSDPDCLIEITKTIKNLKESYTMTFPGVPNFPCPKCGVSQCDHEDPSDKLIPINLTSFFYITMLWKSQM